MYVITLVINNIYSVTLNKCKKVYKAQFFLNFTLMGLNVGEKLPNNLQVHVADLNEKLKCQHK